MANKINKKLALKKETLRSLSETELGAVAGGTLNNSDVMLSVIKPPPPATLGCTTDALILNYQIKYY